MADDNTNDRPKRKDLGAFEGLLYGERSLDDIAEGLTTSDAAPWGMFAKARELKDSDPQSARAILRSITEMEALDSRPLLWAWKALADLGEEVPVPVATQLHGLVLHLATEKGKDIIALYRDGTARYLSEWGDLILWDDKQPHVTSYIESIFTLADDFLMYPQLKRPAETAVFRVSEIDATEHEQLNSIYKRCRELGVFLQSILTQQKTVH